MEFEDHLAEIPYFSDEEIRNATNTEKDGPWPLD